MGIKTSTFFFLLTIFVSVMSHVAVSIAPTPEPEAAVYLIFTEQPKSNEPEAFHIKTLTAVLGSELAAKKALLYSYKNAMSGFCAKLTPAQAKIMLEQPGVVFVTPSKTLHLDSEPLNPDDRNRIFGNS